MHHEHISTFELTQQLGLESIDVYVSRRQLRWLGHVARMSFDRTPRRMLSAWVPAARPAGGQLMTYGRSVAKAMGKFNIPFDTWPQLAMDRASWRGAIHGSLLEGGRPVRSKAVETNRLIDVTLADARAGIWDFRASHVATVARAGLTLPPMAEEGGGT
jgi:hypothetical protein